MPSLSPKEGVAIFFDIGNVLLKYNPRQVARKIALAVGSRPIKFARYLWSSNLVEAIERGKIPPQELYELFGTEFGYAGSFKDFERLWCGHFTLERKNAALLKSLARRYPVYLLSNTNHLHYEHIHRRYAFARQARGAILSHKLGLRKPEPAIYEAALKLAGGRPGQAVFIDDLKANVEAAKKLGIRVIHNVPGTDLKRELAALGVL